MDAEQEQIALDKVVRSHVYDYVMREGLPPTIAETSSDLSRPPNEVRASFQRLADGHILVLQKGSGEIFMAPRSQPYQHLFSSEREVAPTTAIASGMR